MRYMLVLGLFLLLTAHGKAQDDLKCNKLLGNDNIPKGNITEYDQCTDRQDKSYLGKYLCVIDHVGGIQYDDNSPKAEPWIGSIKPKEDRFFMEISEDASVDCGMLFGSGIATNCKTKYKITFKSKNIFLRENSYSALVPQIFHSSEGIFVIVAG